MTVFIKKILKIVFCVLMDIYKEVCVSESVLGKSDIMENVLMVLLVVRSSLKVLVWSVLMDINIQ